MATSGGPYLPPQQVLFTSISDAAYTVTVQQNGTVFLVAQATAARIITLPALKAGLSFKFIFTSVGDDTAGHTWTITSGGANMLGHAGSLAEAAVVIGAPSTNLIRTGTAANAVAGDTVDLICNGTNWFFTGISGGAANPFTVG